MGPAHDAADATGILVHVDVLLDMAAVGDDQWVVGSEEQRQASANHI